MSRINTVLDVGCLRLSIEAGYLSSIETDKVLEKLSGNISTAGQRLSDTEAMQMIVLPLTVQGNRKSKRKFCRRL